MIDLFGSVRLFSRLPEPQLEALGAAAERVFVRRGELVIKQADEGDALFVLASGSLLVRRVSRSGTSRGLNVIEPPGSFGELSLLDSRPRSASIEALEDSELFSISRETFLGLLSRDPRLVDGLIRELGRMIRRLTDQVADEALLDLPSRVAKTLLRLVDDQVMTDPKDEPAVALSQGKLAELAGGSRQSVNGALSTFVVRGLIRMEARRIIITNLPGLRARAGII
ncbi:MAG TPA: Crp/Fnr family transcriptional regulator [Mycobacteriales bacterium]|nr:Crp/Fnr family transcriptional regulator [Mycobacteriales bacterium]